MSALTSSVLTVPTTAIDLSQRKVRGVRRQRDVVTHEAVPIQRKCDFDIKGFFGSDYESSETSLTVG